MLICSCKTIILCKQVKTIFHEKLGKWCKMIPMVKHILKLGKLLWKPRGRGCTRSGTVFHSGHRARPCLARTDSLSLILALQSSFMTSSGLVKTGDVIIASRAHRSVYIQYVCMCGWASEWVSALSVQGERAASSTDAYCAYFSPEERRQAEGEVKMCEGKEGGERQRQNRGMWSLVVARGKKSRDFWFTATQRGLLGIFLTRQLKHLRLIRHASFCALFFYPFFHLKCEPPYFSFSWGSDISLRNTPLSFLKVEIMHKTSLNKIRIDCYAASFNFADTKYKVEKKNRHSLLDTIYLDAAINTLW